MKNDQIYRSDIKCPYYGKNIRVITCFYLPLSLVLDQQQLSSHLNGIIALMYCNMI